MGLYRIIFLVLFNIIIIGCAQVVAPTGGERDEEPPSVLQLNPENETKYFSGRSFKIDFNEFIPPKVLKNLKDT